MPRDIPDTKLQLVDGICYVAKHLLCAVNDVILLTLDLRGLEEYWQHKTSDYQWEEIDLFSGSTEYTPLFFCPKSETEILIFSCESKSEGDELYYALNAWNFDINTKNHNRVISKFDPYAGYCEVGQGGQLINKGSAVLAYATLSGTSTGSPGSILISYSLKDFQLSVISQFNVTCHL